MRNYITKTYPLVIDFLKYNTQENVDKFIYSEKDTNTAFINATLKMNDEKIDLTNYDSVVLGVKKNDGYKVIDQCTILDAVNGQIEIPFNLTSLSSIGMNQFNIALYKGNTILESPKFYYNVVETMIDGDSVATDDNYPILIQLLTQVNEAITKVEGLETKVIEADNLISENERTRIANEEGRCAAEVVREQLEASRQESFSTMQSTVESKIIEIDGNEVIRIASENERIAAENLRKSTMLENQVKFDSYQTQFDNKILEVDNKTSEFETIKTEVIQVKNDTIAVKDETVVVKNNTDAIRVATEETKSQAENKIVEVEGRMKVIEDQFQGMVDGTGFATQTYVDGQDALTLQNAKDYTNEEISKINNLNFLVVPELPLVGETNIIYLLPNESSPNNLYMEYIWLDGKWEIWGSASVDLSDYATKEELLNKSDVGHIHDDRYYQKPEVDTFVTPISTEYIDQLFDTVGGESNPVNYYTRTEADGKFSTIGHTHEMSDIAGLNPSASNVTLSDVSDVFIATNVEDALLENKNSILSLQALVGQANQELIVEYNKFAEML